jgi:hypothetical protein
MVAGTGTPRGMLQCFPTRHLLNTGHRLGEMASVCRTCFIPSDVAEDTDAGDDGNNDDRFFKGVGNAGLNSAGQFEIPQAGDGTAVNTYDLYGNDYDKFTEAWFSEPHGLSQAVHGLNFVLTPVPTE